ncbi:MAG: hypothetical protein EOO75_14860 [Myxococcales bacterium]|nr:MAG: hypothetical protein EOO75_14860 [Myxococcales bacterium]
MSRGAAPLDPEALRAEALTRIDDARARRALDRATVQSAPSTLRWEGSHGEVQGHEVALGVAPGLLADLHAHPASIDALEVALARALGAFPGHCLASLRLHAATGAPAAGAPYRRSS